jgi:ubiquinone/menaquinone biosynthesis C-methylase UbiE
MGHGKPSEFGDVHFAMLAEMDFTKHLGGQQATDELMELCHIDGDTYVLDIGCGVGITPCHIAKVYGCRVVGLDLRGAMVERARQRADREGVGDLAEFRVADARDLPFDDATFDAVVCESVLAFLPERKKAVNEFARVTKPGGYVGISESTWIKEPPPELREQVTASFGGNLDVRSPEEWQALLEAGGLSGVVGRTKEIAVGSEFSNRIKRMGGAKALARLWARIPSVLIKRPVYRSFVKGAFAMPKEVMSYWGYGLYVGQK